MEKLCKESNKLDCKSKCYIHVEMKKFSFTKIHIAFMYKQKQCLEGTLMSKKFDKLHSLSGSVAKIHDRNPVKQKLFYSTTFSKSNIQEILVTFLLLKLPK